ncbi:MAG: hypothetical protein QNJ34_25750 [Xenococcaceae cyanobacterium MO_188.B29]|nr:hypothetical protein [Xenococcaceae cyanobacterium MO_188.B29]
METISTAHQDFLMFLKNYPLPKYDTPILPYRRVLSDAEYEQIWTKFESLWLKGHRYTALRVRPLR